MYRDERRKASPHYALRAQGAKRHTVQDEKNETLVIALLCSIIASACTVLFLRIIGVA